MPRAAVALALLLLLALAAGRAPAQAGARDLHAYWDDRCKSCHEDAGTFARRTLTVTQGRLVGRHHRDDLARFLRNHYLADDLIEPVTAMLAVQAVARPLFAQRCAGCHGSAASFARASLAFRGGVLHATGRNAPLRDVLAAHGSLRGADRAAMQATLERVTREVGKGGDAVR
jgi:hypothetical protein